MTTEQLAALKEVAEKAAETLPHPEGCRCMRDFERAFRPATCAELVGELTRLREQRKPKKTIRPPFSISSEEQL